MKRKSPFLTTPLLFEAPSPENPREYLHKPYTAKNYVPCMGYIFVADSIWVDLQIFEQFCPKAGDANPSVAESGVAPFEFRDEPDISKN